MITESTQTHKIDTPVGIEVLNPELRPGPVRLAVFDFDGTVSLIREGWAGVMADLGVDLFRAQGRDADSVLRDRLELEMLGLSGHPSLVQMQRLAEIAGGGDADELHAEFLRRLFNRVGCRVADLEAGRVPQSAWSVPGTHAILTALRDRGAELVLLSGTDRAGVVREMAALGLSDFFGERVYAPTAVGFTKRAVLDSLGVSGPELLGVGDGFAETVEVKRLGGRAIGVASQEAGVPGVNPVKRQLLTSWGADALVADYSQADALVSWLYGE